jgi:hypothetical protein
MKTSAQNRRLHSLLRAIIDGNLIPNPEFQRRLVWTNSDKLNFLRTVLGGYPFPEIYVAAGSIDRKTGRSTEILVDGQQRITTLKEYFEGSETLKLRDLVPYNYLSEEAQLAFLEYEVVVRDLGALHIQEIKEIFQRINSTSYPLNAMEFNHARYDGEFKKLGEELALNSFFEKHRIFSSNDIRRMNDIRFTLTIVITIMYSYFNRWELLEQFLSLYNDEFSEKEQIRHDLETIFMFIDQCRFHSKSRIWKTSDLLTAIVELFRLMIIEGRALNRGAIEEALTNFYESVDLFNRLGFIERVSPYYTERDVMDYGKAAQQGTNNRGNRITRGEILREVIIRTIG